MNKEKSILPPNATPLQKDLENAIAFRLGKLDIPNRWLMNPEKCPEHILPWLAWAVSVDVWNDAWAVETRRAVIKASLQVHKQKGTIGALKRALAAFNFDNTQVEEWFEYGGEPFHFKVLVEVLTADFDILELTEVYSVIQSAKNVRSHLDSLETYLATRTNMPIIAAAIMSGEVITIYPKE